MIPSLNGITVSDGRLNLFQAASALEGWSDAGSIVQYGTGLGGANVATLDSVLELERAIAAPGWRCEVVQISVARGRSVGGRTRLAALNPVFILTAWPDGLEGAR